MPGRFFLETPLAEVAAWLGAETPGFVEPPRRNVAPGEDILVCTPGKAIRHMRWGIIPVGRVNARGRPVMDTIVNARGESLFEKSAFDGLERAVVPCDGWYEWTGKARRKTAWRIRPVSGGPVAFAAITDRWQAPGGRVVEQVATVTCAPNAEVQAIHHRMGVVLDRGGVDAWLGGDEAAARALVRPLPDGSLVIEAADDVDWAQP